ncbi:MAG: hypothetical protein KTR28_07245 [Micavibrio sp.]|nr:hypothetical protein [Micavibrio sp.]
MNGLEFDPLWWVGVFNLPAMAGLLLLIWRTRGENVAEIDALQSLLDRRCEQFREGLGAFKLEVAKTYASQGELKELEMRIVSHLLRIEAKLDKTALKAAEMAHKAD